MKSIIQNSTYQILKLRLELIKSNEIERCVLRNVAMERKRINLGE
jgi:hypothetical protein